MTRIPVHVPNILLILLIFTGHVLGISGTVPDITDSGSDIVFGCPKPMVRNMIPGHVPDIVVRCSEYNQNSWSYFGYHIMIFGT